MCFPIYVYVCVVCLKAFTICVGEVIIFSMKVIELFFRLCWFLLFKP